MTTLRLRRSFFFFVLSSSYNEFESSWQNGDADVEKGTGRGSGSDLGWEEGSEEGRRRGMGRNRFDLWSFRHSKHWKRWRRIEKSVGRVRRRAEKEVLFPPLPLPFFCTHSPPVPLKACTRSWGLHRERWAREWCRRWGEEPRLTSRVYCQGADVTNERHWRHA